MRKLTFTLDTQTGSDGMAPATLTIAETPQGTLSFIITNEADSDSMIGDLRALFFDVSDDGLLRTLSVSGNDITEFVQEGEVSNLGGGATSSGVPDSPYEVGIEFGTSGMSRDDIQTTTFTLASSLRGLTLDDIAFESMTVRQTSVGEIDGSRGDSDKLYGNAPYPVDAIDDAIELDEDTSQTINVFANDIDLDAPDDNLDGIGDTLAVTSVDGNRGLVGETVEFADSLTFVLSEDGTLTIDATDADYLSAGETITHTLTYSVDDGNGGSDDAEVVITVNGVNDDPTAVADEGTTDESSSVSGNLLDNDSDVDRLDTISVSAVNGNTANVGATITLESGALLTLGADGNYTYDPNGAFDHLNDGETATDSFTYDVMDNHGAVSTAIVQITIDGIGQSEPQGDHFGTFSNKKGTADHAISNIVLYLQGPDGDFTKVKIDGWDNGESDLDNVNLDAFLDDEFFDFDLVAVSIKAGNNHNRDLGPGEGQLFLLDGDEDIDYVAGGSAPDGLTNSVLSARADMTFDFDDALFT
ncbi:Ig-like domain-containing protein [Roseibium sp.]|uniref:Ig-like domain-containing protein n=1 Tax=Roseibium sp. TaxID=1936156 RepID=UPI003A97931F